MSNKRKHSNNELVTRAYVAEFRAAEEESEKGVIEGTPIVFNQRTRIYDWAGEYDEIIERGALEGADLKDVRLFVNHDFNKIALARSKNGNENSTMSFNIDDDGLHMKAQLDTENNAEARALYSAIKRGDMDGMSFAFRIKDDEWKDIDSDLPTRIIKRISIVHEVSVVNFPAYQGTSISARSEGEETPYSALEEARKAHAEETAKRTSKELEIEKLKNENLIKLFK